MRLSSPPTRLRLVAAIALVAVFGCFVAAAGLFAGCHASEEPMSCCPDAGGVPSNAGAQSLSATLPVVVAQFGEVAPPSLAALGLSPAPLGHGSRRDMYLRLTTLLI